MYYIYMLRCVDNSIYTGITVDISRRFNEHKNKTKRCAKYTYYHDVNKLESVWVCKSRALASKMEYSIKKLTKNEKEELIKDASKICILLKNLDYKEYVNIGTNMLYIENLKDRPEYIHEYAVLCKKQWGKEEKSKEEFNRYIEKKVEKIKNNLLLKDFCVLLLLNKDELVGFISIFPNDLEERKDLSPWYATMYVKEKYRKNGYSKILNDAILNEAQKRGYDKLYLKTTLINYYEKFGAIPMEELNNNEKLLFFNLR